MSNWLRKRMAAAWSGGEAFAARRYPNLVACGCLIAAFVPYLTARGIDVAWRSDRRRADALTPSLVVTAQRLGVDELPPADARERIESRPGVRRATPCLAGEASIGRRYEAATVIGLPFEDLARFAGQVEGELPGAESANELVLGSGLARRLGLSVGSRIPPFYRNPAGERVSRITGVLRDDAPSGRANWILTTVAGAATILGHPPQANEFWVECEPDRLDELRETLRGLTPSGPSDAGWTWQVATGEERFAPRLAESARGTSGAANLLLVVLSGVALVVRSGLGGAEYARETALLSALGWSRGAIFLRATAEGMTVAVLAIAAASCLAWMWLEWGEGAGFVSLLYPGWEVRGVGGESWDGAAAVISGCVGAGASCAGSWWETARALAKPPAAVLR